MTENIRLLLQFAFCLLISLGIPSLGAWGYRKAARRWRHCRVSWKYPFQ